MSKDDAKAIDSAENEQKLAYYEASQWALMRRRFSKHKVALWMLFVVVILYALCLNCDFFAPYGPVAIHKDWTNLPPQYTKVGQIEGSSMPWLYVNPYKRVRNPITLAERYYVDSSRRLPVRLFARGRPWKFLGLLETDIHFFGVDPEPMMGVADESVEPASAKPMSVTIADDRETDGLQYTRVTVASGDLEASGIQPGDTLRLFAPGADGRRSSEYADYRIASILDKQTAMLDHGPYDPVEAPATAEVWREHTIFLLGTGPLGQDLLSRMLYGGRISLLLGLTGVILSFTLGITLGGISGYFGGKIDMLIQRIAEILMTVPKIPIWLALSAAIPKNWTSLQVYFSMTLILACMGWTGLCRVVRGKLLALREEDYARAALLAGATERRVIFVHLVPNFASHIIASLTLAIPGMILAETSLSFLGLGLRPPIVSWGVLLQQTQRVEVVESQPWLLLPAGMVVLTVLAFNFVGEGLRDAADPYAT
jgi:ABC-type dipeptide/oligopeptide/nickel transport system permease subunit